MQVAWTRHEQESWFLQEVSSFDPLRHMSKAVPVIRLKDSVLHLLAAFGLTNTLHRRLTKEGISVEAVAPMGRTQMYGPRTLLICAVEGHRMDTIRYLIKHGANLEVSYGVIGPLKQPVLLATIFGEHLEPMRALLDGGASQATIQEAFDNDELLYKSALYRRPTVLKTLLDYGFDPDLVYCSRVENDVYWKTDHSVIQSLKMLEDARQSKGDRRLQNKNM